MMLDDVTIEFNWLRIFDIRYSVITTLNPNRFNVEFNFGTGPFVSIHTSLLKDPVSKHRLFVIIQELLKLSGH